MLRTIVRGVVLALLTGLAVAVPSAPHAAAMTSWPTEAQYAQLQTDMASVEAANQQTLAQGGTLSQGTIDYLCDVHGQSMSGTIVVNPVPVTLQRFEVD